MSYKSFRKWSDSLYKTDIVLPEAVSRVTQIGPQ